MKLFKNKNIIKCDECKHYVDKSDCQVVEVHSAYSIIGEISVREEYYCKLCRKPYDYVQGRFGGDFGSNDKYYIKNDQQVTKEGKAVK